MFCQMYLLSLHEICILYRVKWLCWWILTKYYKLLLQKLLHIRARKPTLMKVFLSKYILKLTQDK